MKKEQLIFLGKENFYSENSTGSRLKIQNKDLFNPLDKKNPLKDETGLKSVLTKTMSEIQYDSPLTFILPDILFFSKVIHFDQMPLSLNKQKDMINWKISSYLPADSDRYDIRYFNAQQNVLVYALPVNISTKLINSITAAVHNRTWNLIPESVYFMNQKLNTSKQYSGMMIINRPLYFTAVVLDQGIPVIIRTRLKVVDIDMDAEIEIIKNIVNENQNSLSDTVEVIGRKISSIPYFSEQEWE